MRTGRLTLWAIAITVGTFVFAGIANAIIQEITGYGLRNLGPFMSRNLSLKGWQMVLVVIGAVVAVPLPVFLLVRSLLLLSLLRKLGEPVVGEWWLSILPDLAPRADRAQETRNLARRWIVLNREHGEVVGERDNLEKERERLETERDNLSEQRDNLDKEKRVVEKEREESTQVLDLDERLLALLPALIPPGPKGERASQESSQSREQELRQRMSSLLSAVLRDAESVFEGNVYRSRTHMLHPDPDNEEWLISWERYELQKTEKSDVKFRIKDDNESGAIRLSVAGHAFVRGETTVVHLRKDGKGLWEADHEEYVFRSGRNVDPRYLTLAAVPIFGAEKPLGVLCMDTMKKDAFDSPAMQEFLFSLGVRIGTAMRLYEKLRLEISGEK